VTSVGGRPQASPNWAALVTATATATATATKAIAITTVE